MDAKKFLVSRIVQEAARRHVPLSDLEQGMLYFSESYPSLPDMAEIAERFESEYDDEEYEKKIRRLAKSAYQRDSKESPETARLWRQAINVLKREDHYILVMIHIPRSAGEVWKLLLTPRSAGEVWKLLLTAAVVVALGLSTIVALDWASHHILTSVPDSVRLLAFILLFALLYFLAWSDKTSKKVGDWLGQVIKRIIDW